VGLAVDDQLVAGGEGVGHGRLLEGRIDEDSGRSLAARKPAIISRRGRPEDFAPPLSRLPSVAKHGER
jgi:hypothetical protein